jgi:hypothetical protein
MKLIRTDYKTYVKVEIFNENGDFILGYLFIDKENAKASAEAFLVGWNSCKSVIEGKSTGESIPLTMIQDLPNHYNIINVVS